MLTYTRFPLTFAECWYTKAKPPKNVDVVHYFQLPSAPRCGYVEEFKTIAIDLRESKDELFRGLNKTTRNEIRRAASDDCVYEFLSLDIARYLKEFLAFYETNTLVKGSSTEATRWASRYAANGTLNLSRVIQSSGRELVWHAYFRDGDRARLKYSVCLSQHAEEGNARAVISRANRFAHWKDICHLKDSGASMYDFGGWYTGTSDEKLLRVNQFKESFGGRLMTSYHSQQAFSTWGKLFLVANGIRRRLRACERLSH